DGFHQWATGVKDNEVAPWSNEPVSVELYWPAGARYELSVRDGAAQTEFTPITAPRQMNPNSASIRFTPQAGSRYQVRVRLAAGPPGHFHLVALGGGLERATASDSVCFPADGSEVVAVGAVDSAGRRQDYSACGSASCVGKPELVGAVPFVSAWRSRP